MLKNNIQRRYFRTPFSRDYWYQAFSATLRDRLVTQWMKTQDTYSKQQSRRAYYLSLEFLIGRLLGNNAMNLKMYDACAIALKGSRLEWEDLQELERDPGLGNGGLGRLAACFVDSLATMHLPCIGYGLRYKLTLTGNLGDVMKESAVIALEYIKAHSDTLGIEPDVFEKKNVHIHVPEGAIPKDGPSAGVTMVTSLVSSFTRRRVKPRLAMTGEITLRGKVLPVGGIKEKILAAKRAGVKTVILSSKNKKDIDDINSIYIKGLSFKYVDTIAQVLDISFND